MAKGDGKNKFYRKLNIHDDIKKMIRFYNKVWRKEAYKRAGGDCDGSTGKVYIGRD